MPDYSSLLKAQLVTLLEERDTEIEEKNQQITTLQTEVKTLRNQLNPVTKPSTNNALIVSEKIDQNIITSAIDRLVEGILSLPDEVKQELPFILRTTATGIQAYTTVLYGASTGIQAQNGGIGEE